MCDVCDPLRALHVALVGWVGLSAACGAPEPTPQREWHAVPAEVEPESVEWLYATDGFGGDRAAECRHVLEWVEGEKDCSNVLCRHGAKLAFDWVRTCQKKMPKDVARVKELTQTLERRSVLGSGRCEDDASSVVRDGCGERGACAEKLQKWGTRCGDAGTPLIRRMLELAARRAGETDFRLDARSCDDLANELRTAAGCEPGFACEDALPIVELHASRCDAEGTAPPPATVALRFALLAGAGQSPPPTAVAADEQPIDLGDGWVHLADGSGVVLTACGRRVKTVDEYLGVRASCTPAGEIVVARARRSKTGRELRAGRIALEDDRSFWRRYPSLAARGEADLRDQKWLAAFTAALDRAATTKPGPEATARLLEALIAYAHRLNRSEAFARAVTDRDEALIPVLREIGAAKRSAAKPTLRAVELVPFVSRAEQLVLADVNASGKVSLGATTPVSWMDLAALLPKAVAAYREELTKTVTMARKRKVAPEDLENHAVVAGEASARCGAATIQAESSELSLVDCAIGVETCEPEKLERETTLLDQAMREATESHAALVVAVASLDPVSREAARQVIAQTRCEPAIR